MSIIIRPSGQRNEGAPGLLSTSACRVPVPAEVLEQGRVAMTHWREERPGYHGPPSCVLQCHRAAAGTEHTKPAEA